MTLTPRQAQLAASACVVLIMSATVVTISTALNFGFTAEFPTRFFRGWGIAFCVAYPLVLTLSPFFQKVFKRFVKN